MLEDKHRCSFYCQLIFLAQQGISFALVHGGGRQVTAGLKAAGIEAQFQRGLRVTDDATMQITERILINEINPQIVQEINDCWAAYNSSDNDRLKAISLDARTVFQTEPLSASLGRVGKVKQVNTKSLRKSWEKNHIVVMAPIGWNTQTKLSYNINADWAAASVAIALKDSQLLYITDEDGVLDKKGNKIAQITSSELQLLQEDGTISTGMIPKTESILAAIINKVKNIRVVSGTNPHSLLRTLAGDEDIGTLFNL